MTAVAIQLDRVSKRFALRTEGTRSFQETVIRSLRGQRWDRQEFWALRDVSLTVDPGETLGLIGPNGSGKSTILKLISRILVPTSGNITVNGKVSTLLELGAGFHPDLTGRENIYLNGSVMGLSRREIKARMGDIIAFAELERFIDMPVKHYSSGMYMRLGFSVAVHVEPDILLVDEVLAVGDQSFQQKCYAHIATLRKRGVTILFVSHGLDTVRSLCERCVWLDQGEIRLIGRADAVVDAYVNSTLVKDGEQIRLQRDEDGLIQRWGTRDAEIVDVKLLDENEQEQAVFETDRPFIARIRYRAHACIEEPLIGIALHNREGVHINGSNTVTSGFAIPALEGEGTIDYVVPSLPLLQGTYLLSAAIYDRTGQQAYDHHHQVYPFSVQAHTVKERLGMFYIPCQWDWRPE